MKNRKNPKLLLADELKTSLKSLILALDLGSSVSLYGSPTASILASISDLLSVASSQLRRHKRWQLLANPGLKFVEQVSLTEEEAESRNSRAWYDPLLSDRSIDDDPFDLSQRSGDIFYENQFDPLGNPLQIEISYDNIIPSLSTRDRRKIAQFLEDIEHTLSQLSAGLVDWRFMRHFRNFVSGATTKTVRHKRNNQQKHYYWRKQRGSSIIKEHGRKGSSL